jgi:hypothetical protein
MVYRVLAEVVVVIHFGFVVFVVVGGFLAWRWPRLLLLHVPAIAWGLVIVTVGARCPLTTLERHLRSLGGENGRGQGFIDRYIEGVVYPGHLTRLAQAVAATAIAASYVGLVARRREAGPRRATAPPW